MVKVRCKKTMSITKERSCNWCIQLYPDNENHTKALELIEQNYQEYAWIKHRPESDEKKEHIHVVIHFKNYRWNTALAEELNIELNMFQKCRGLDNALLYLVHFREPEKIQYSLDEVHGFYRRRLDRLIQSDGKDKADIASDIVGWINEQPNEIKRNQLFYYCVSNGYYGELVRGANLFFSILSEHNADIVESRYGNLH